jgi:ABC-2 type transport system ATP-binding protein
MKQKVGIVQCLLGEPRVLFLDEPMRGLDPLAVREFREILLERNRQGVTIVMNSHILSEVELVATRAAILDRGRVVAEGRLEDLIPADEDAYVVAVAPSASFPDYFAATGGSAEAMEGTVPASRFYDFLEFTRAQRLQVFSCAVRKGTLEDAFLRILKVPAARA